MSKATPDDAARLAHLFNLTRETVWEIIQGLRYRSAEELELAVCKALARL